MTQDDEQSRRKLKQRAAGHKASETKGPDERSRAGKKAAWTKKHGRDDARNPHARRTLVKGP